MDIQELRKRIFKLINEAFSEGETNFLPIETPMGSPDFNLFKGIVNQGIDSSLEGFTKSVFEKSPTRPGFFLFNFDKSELPVLLRRLEENGSDEALSWKSDIEDNSVEGLDEELRGSDFLNLDDQFDLPTDLDYTPDKSDIEAIENKWGKGKYIDKPISDEEIDDISNNIKRSRLGIDSDETEFKELEQGLNQQNKKGGSSVNRRMNAIGMSAN